MEELGALDKGGTLISSTDCLRIILGQPLDSWEPPLVTQVRRLGRQQLTTLQDDLPGLSSLEDLAAWCEQAKQRP